jgi:hypothetical protein
MSKNIVETERLQLTIWGMHVACWISKATLAQAHILARSPTKPPTTSARTHTQKYVIHIALPQQQWLRKRTWMLRYTHIASFILSSLFTHICLDIFDFRYFPPFLMPQGSNLVIKSSDHPTHVTRCVPSRQRSPLHVQKTGQVVRPASDLWTKLHFVNNILVTSDPM